MTMAKAAIVCAALAALLLACEGKDDSTTKALSLWIKNAPEKYTYRYSTRCKNFSKQCPDGIVPGMNSGLFHVTVKGDKVAKVEEIWAGKRSSKGFKTVVQIFADLLSVGLKGRKQSAKRKVTTELDEENGFPTSIIIEGQGQPVRVETLTLILTKEQQLKKLNEARAKWDAARPEVYTFRLLRSCIFCGAAVTITVENGIPRHTDPKAAGVGEEGLVLGGGRTAVVIPSNLVNQLATIDDLFDDIERDLHSNPDFYDVEYDPVTGVPVNVDSDFSLLAIDDEGGFSVELFA